MPIAAEWTDWQRFHQDRSNFGGCRKKRPALRTAGIVDYLIFP
jgi:hypothetical protein